MTHILLFLIGLLIFANAVGMIIRGILTRQTLKNGWTAIAALLAAVSVLDIGYTFLM